MDEAHARRSDPHTSYEAAGSITRLRIRQHAVLKVLQDYGPMCDQALIPLYQTVSPVPQSESGIRTRRNELVDKGLVKDSGRFVLLKTNRRAIIWEAVSLNGTG